MEERKMADEKAAAVAKDAKPKKERKKRERRPPQVPELDSFKDPLSKKQFSDVLDASKMFVDSIKTAKAVQGSYLKEVRKAVNVALMAHFKELRGDPVAKKRARLESAIARAQAKLEELG
jgi:hypothetical protein